MAYTSWMSSTLFRECYATFVILHLYILGGSAEAFPAYLITQLQKNAVISVYLESWLGSVTRIVGIFSTFVNVLLLSIIGRKPNVQLCFFIFMVSWLSVAFSPNPTTICFSLGLLGLPYNSVLPLITTYLTETVRTERRGILLSVSIAFKIIGNFLAYLLNSFLYWKVTAVILAVISLSGFLQSFVVPETQYWHIINNRTESARTSLRWFQPRSTSDEIDSQITTIQDSLREEYDAKENLFAKFVKSFCKFRYLKLTILGSALFVVEVGSGRPVMAAYVSEIFRDLHTPYDPKLLGDGYGIFGIIGAAVTLTLVYGIRRKPIFYASSLIMVCSLCVTIGYQFYIAHAQNRPYPWLPVVGLYIYSAMISGPFSTTITVIPVEIQYPPFRGLSTTLFMFIQFSFAFFYDKMFPYTEVALPIQYVLLFFTINVVVGILIVMLFIPETSKKEFYEK